MYERREEYRTLRSFAQIKIELILPYNKVIIVLEITVVQSCRNCTKLVMMILGRPVEVMTRSFVKPHFLEATDPPKNDTGKNKNLSQ